MVLADPRVDRGCTDPAPRAGPNRRAPADQMDFTRGNSRCEPIID
jgi:hypothetical protein